MSIHEKLREMLDDWHESATNFEGDQDWPHRIAALLDEPEAPSDAAESVEALRADIATLSRALAETAGEEPERPEGIPKRTFWPRDPYTDLRGWLAQRITYASFVEGKMPDANRRYLAKAWGRDLKLALSALNKSER